MLLFRTCCEYQCEIEGNGRGGTNIVKTKKKATAETYAFWRKGQDMGLSGSVGERL